MGPLSSLKVVALDAQGASSAACSFLGSLGAQVLRVLRSRGDNPHHESFAAYAKGDWVDPGQGILGSARWTVAADLKHPAGLEAVIQLAERADILVEGFRPGTAERIGIGPEVCLARNPKLVYLRSTGWGQIGPLSKIAGHDINYIAIAGALDPIGRQGEPPMPPLNLLGDVAGGLHAAFGALAAAFEASHSGKGQVVDAAMLDSAAQFMDVVYLMHAMGAWSLERGTNLMDTGAPFYNVYQTADDKYVAVSAFEPQFYSVLLSNLGLDEQSLPPQMDRKAWPLIRGKIADAFRAKTRDEWASLLENTDACVSPVLSLEEAPNHPHNKARGNFVNVGGLTRPATGPRFSRSEIEARPKSHPSTPESRRQSFLDWGFSETQIDELISVGAIS